MRHRHVRTSLGFTIVTASALLLGAASCGVPVGDDGDVGLGGAPADGEPPADDGEPPMDDGEPPTDDGGAGFDPGMAPDDMSTPPEDDEVLDEVEGEQPGEEDDEDPRPGDCGPNRCDEGCDGTLSCGTLSIFVVDIGQGDATVVLGPPIAGRRTALVIDAGNRHPDGGAIVGSLLEDLGVTEIDFVVLSHFDGDHIGGFVTVSGSTSLLWESERCEPTGWFPTQAIFDQGIDTNDTVSSRQWLSCVPAITSARNITYSGVHGGLGVGTELDLGGGHWATIVAGDGYVWDRSDRVASVNTPNERSIAVLVSNEDGFDFLVTGDLIGRASGAENARVEGALGDALVTRNIDVEVLRTGHHGADNASDADFLVDIAPEVAIVSTGDSQGSNYHHPRCSTYENLESSLIGLLLQTELGNSDCANDPPIEPVVVNGTIRIDAVGTDYTITNHGTESRANGLTTTTLDEVCTLNEGC